jgi:hypothetical protein
MQRDLSDERCQARQDAGYVGRESKGNLGDPARIPALWRRLMGTMTQCGQHTSKIDTQKDAGQVRAELYSGGCFIGAATEDYEGRNLKND